MVLTMVSKWRRILSVHSMNRQNNLAVCSRKELGTISASSGFRNFGEPPAWLICLPNQIANNVNPGLINPWLINFSTPLMGRVLLRSWVNIILGK